LNYENFLFALKRNIDFEKLPYTIPSFEFHKFTLFKNERYKSQETINYSTFIVFLIVMMIIIHIQSKIDLNFAKSELQFLLSQIFYMI